MKNATKRMLAALSATALLLTGLSACGDKKETQAADEESVSQSVEVTTEGAADTAPATENTENSTVQDMVTPPAIETKADMTDEEYNQTCITLATASLYVSSRYSNIDLTDSKAAKATFEEMKAPFEAFQKIEAPAKFAEAHKQYVTSCDTMLSALDCMIKAADTTDVNAQTEQIGKAAEYIMNSQNELNDAATAAKAAA